MRLSSMRVVAAALGAAMPLSSADPTLAQNADQSRPRNAQPPADGEGKRRSTNSPKPRSVLGGPAANPECLWLGRRVVSLLWRDDLDTAFRHLDLYDRFGCPAGHIQATFRCLVRQGNIDPKAPTRSTAGCIPAGSIPSAEAQGTAAAPGGTTNR